MCMVANLVCVNALTILRPLDISGKICIFNFKLLKGTKYFRAFVSPVYSMNGVTSTVTSSRNILLVDWQRVYRYHTVQSTSITN